MIVKWMKKIMKKMIRLKIKTNFAALGQEYGCDYRTAKLDIMKN